MMDLRELQDLTNSAAAEAVNAPTLLAALEAAACVNRPDPSEDDLRRSAAQLAARRVARAILGRHPTLNIQWTVSETVDGKAFIAITWAKEIDPFEWPTVGSEA